MKMNGIQERTQCNVNGCKTHMANKIVCICVLFCLGHVAVTMAQSAVIDALKEYPVTVISLPKGELHWTNERPTDVKACIPAAFTDERGKVIGEYRIGGKTYGKRKYKVVVSIRPDIFYVDNKWHGDEGFQQLALVHNGQVMHFKDTRKYVRRALCKNKEGMFLLESDEAVTLNQFAKYCGKVSTEAVYLDMGSFGYGFVGSTILSPQAYFGRNKQTNWIYVK